MILLTLFFENGCWKVTAEILEKKNYFTSCFYLLWCCLSLNIYIQQYLNLSSLQVQILPAPCWRYALVIVSDDCLIRVYASSRSIIPHKQFIIIRSISSRFHQYPLDTSRILNKHETFTRRPKCLLNVSQFRYCIQGLKRLVTQS